MDSKNHLGRLQHSIMRVLWDEREATIARVHEVLKATGGERALTTIATMLTKMEKKGVVDHVLDGRQYIYRPTVEEKAIHRSMVANLTEQLFDGDVTALVSHLLTEQEIDPDELDRLRSLIAGKTRKAKDGRRG